MKEKVVLAYSGGLDTSVSIKWLIDKGYDVVACCLDIGEGKDSTFIHQKALDLGATESYMIDAQQEFAEFYVSIAIKSNTMYEGKYPLVSALSRPLIAKKLVEVAHKESAKTIAHGCTGKGNDQVRFEVAISTLDPNINVIAPVREWKWSREEEIQYAKDKNIPIPINLDSPYSIDQNLWGRANECGALENPWVTPPEDAYNLTVPVEDAPDTADYIQITFEKGVPTKLNNIDYPLHQLILKLNQLAGKHGVGRIDHIENRLVGIKSREVYECPGAVTLIKAHQELESLTLVKEIAHFKPTIEKKLAETIYNGLWFNPLTECLKKFIENTQRTVTGQVRIKLFKGQATIEGRKSSVSLYNKDLATYTSSDTFNQDAALGFIELYGLPSKVYAEVQTKTKEG